MSDRTSPRLGAGSLLALFGFALVIWLSATGTLGWYIHPRYFWFTLTMVVLGAVALLAAETAPASGATRRSPRTSFAARARSIGAFVLVGASAITLLVLPPATLTASSAVQRATTGGGANEVMPIGRAEALAAAPDGELTIQDWSQLVRQPDTAAVSGRTAVLTGFVSPEPSDPERLFLVTRFVINCCAVDAQPVGIPIYRPGWQRDLEPDDWVTIQGAFAHNPSVRSPWTAALIPTSIERVEAPEDPYVTE